MKEQLMVSNIRNWKVPREWVGERCFILGGGPSFDAPEIAPSLKGRIIAVNESVVERPDADVLYWADPQWAEANIEKIMSHTGKYKVTRRLPNQKLQPHTKILDWCKQVGEKGVRKLSTDPTMIGGYCSGSNALNLAYLFGANPIILLGFDMRTQDGKTNYHDRHIPKPSLDEPYKEKFIKHIVAMAKRLDELGIKVYNCSSISILTCFEYVPVEHVVDIKTIKHHQKSRLWIIPDIRLSMCLITKAACTSVKLALRETFGSEKKEEGLTRKLFRYKDRPFDMSAFMRVALVRSPWERLRSCYVDKIVTTREMVKPLALREMGCYPNMPFHKFIWTVCSTNDLWMDKHVLPQYCLIESPLWGGEADMFIHIEHIDRDWSKLCKMYPTLPNKLGMYNNSGNRKPEWTPGTIGLIRNRYEHDIKLLKYEEPRYEHP